MTDSPTRVASSDPLVGRQLAEYRIDAVLGRGGMGTVYRATDTALDIPVALKAIAPALAADDAFVRRFRTEARAMARVASPHIVRVMALRELELAPATPATDSEPARPAQRGLFIVMEYVDGGDLHAAMAAGPMPWAQLWPLLRQMLLGLEAAHAVGVVHRDIKPRNVLLTRPSAEASSGGPSSGATAGGTRGAVAKLTDFGLARLSDADATRTQAVAGTLAYMSPEQVRALPSLDHRSDLFSLALVAYEALTGGLPFARAGGEFTVMRAIVEQEFAPPAGVPPAVSAALMRALSKEAEGRYASAAAMREALAAAGDDLTPTLTRVPRAPRPRPAAASTPNTPAASAPVPARRVSPVLLAGGLALVAAVVAAGVWLARPATIAPAPADGALYFLNGEPLAGRAEVAPGTHELRCLAGGISATTEVEVGRGQTSRVACHQPNQTVNVAASWNGAVDEATVVVNGGDETNVPARLSLPTGRHVLRIRSVEAGRIDSTVTVDVRPTFDPEPPPPLAVRASTAPVVADARPDPRPAPSGPTTGPAAPTPVRPPPGPPAGGTTPPPPLAMGIVDVAMAPGVTLSVDGSSMSTGSRELRPGTYTARCTTGPLSETTQVTVTAGQRTPIQCYAPSRAVRISVTSTDAERPWMTVMVDGQPQGQTPTQVTLPVGRHTVFVQRRGYEVASQDMITVDVPPRFVAEPLAPLPLSFQVRSAQTP